MNVCVYVRKTAVKKEGMSEVDHSVAEYNK